VLLLTQQLNFINPPIIIVVQESILQFLVVFGVSQLLFSLDGVLIETLDLRCVTIENFI